MFKINVRSFFLNSGNGWTFPVFFELNDFWQSFLGHFTFFLRIDNYFIIGHCIVKMAF